MVSDLSRASIPATSVFLVPNPRDFQFVDLLCSYDFPAGGRDVQVTRLLAWGRFLYALRRGRVACPEPWLYEIVAIDTKNDSCHILNIQPINSDSWSYAGGKDRAFLLGAGLHRALRPRREHSLRRSSSIASLLAWRTRSFMKITLCSY